MPVLKQLFGVQRELKFELCVTYADNWEEDIANAITEAMVKVTQDIIRGVQNEALQYANQTLLGTIEAQSSENLDDFADANPEQKKQAEENYKKFLKEQENKGK